MKKIILLFMLVISVVTTNAKTPILDSKITVNEYDERISIADHISSPFNIANCKQMYFAQDANYYYLATTFDADISMNWAFILSLNGVSGGMLDPRPRMVAYDHTMRPNLMLSGDFNTKSPIPYLAYFNNGPLWDSPVKFSGSQMATNITPTNTNGCLEISIPKSFLTDIKKFDVQFYLSSATNKNTTVFDAIPDDNIAPSESENTLLHNYARPSTALPITLTEFNATLVNETITLKWEYKDPSNFSHFEILRNDVVIGSTKNTSFKDLTPAAENLYKLKMVDNDGAYTYSKTISVILNNENTIKVLQNPVTDVLKLQFTGKAGIQSISVYSSEGKRVYSTTYQHIGNTSIANFNLPILPSGVYRAVINNKVLNIFIQ